MSIPNYQYEPLPVPISWSREEKQFAQRLTDVLDDIYQKWGRLTLKDLSGSLREMINSKVSGGDLEAYATLEELSGQLAAAVNGLISLSDLGEVLASYSTITQTADMISTEVANLVSMDDLGTTLINYSTIQQTATAISSAVASLVSTSDLANYSTIQQTADSIALKVSQMKIGSRNLLLGTNEGSGTASSSGALVSYELACPYSELAGADCVISFDYVKSVSSSTTVYLRMGSSSGTSAVSVGAAGTSGRVEVPFTFSSSLSSFTAMTLTVSSLSGTIAVSRVKLERGGKATDWCQADEELIASSGVVITKDKVQFSTPVFEVGYGQDNFLTLDKSGGYFPKIGSPQIKPVYDGPNTLYVNSGSVDGVTDFATLSDVFGLLSGKTLPYNVLVGVSSAYTAYGEHALSGVDGPGKLTVACGGTVISGAGLAVSDCGARIFIHALSASKYGTPFTVTGCRYVLFGASCVATNTAATGAGYLYSQGSNGYLSTAASYGGAYAIQAETASQILTENCLGDKNVCADGSVVICSGTVPCAGSTLEASSLRNGQVFNEGCAVNRGTAGDAPASVTAYTLYPSATAWHQGVWCQASTAYRMMQGYTAYGQITGCMWFGMSALSGKTVKGATLRLTRVTGYGQTGKVKIRLVALGAGCTGRGTTLSRSTVYGVIGELAPGETGTFTVPNAAVQALINGTIGGLALFAEDASVMTGQNVSQNYANIQGTGGTTDTKPCLIVRT